MIKKNGKKLVFLLVSLSIIFITTTVYSHSGRTDANGGHKDNQNKSGLGSYHYHCGGYPGLRCIFPTLSIQSVPKNKNL